MLKTEAGRTKINVVIKDMTQLHGRTGCSDVVGIMECHNLVGEFEKLKAAKGAPFLSRCPKNDKACRDDIWKCCSPDFSFENHSF